MISVVMSCYPFTWASEGETGANTLFENFSKKVVFLVSSGKTEFNQVWTHLEKFWKNPLVAHPGKNPSDAHAPPPLLKTSHTSLRGALLKCCQSGPALAKAGPVYRSRLGDGRC